MVGVSLFNAGSETAVPKYGPVFKAMGKAVFGFCDKPNAPPTVEAAGLLAQYTQHWFSPHKGVEVLLVEETASAVHERFLLAVQQRDDYPAQLGKFDVLSDDAAKAKALALNVLKVRKGEAYGYAAMFIRQCETADQLPKTIRGILEAIHAGLATPDGDGDDDDLADLLGDVI